MKKARVCVSIDAETISEIDKEANQYDKSRSACVRRILKMHTDKTKSEL